VELDKGVGRINSESNVGGSKNTSVTWKLVEKVMKWSRACTDKTLATTGRGWNGGSFHKKRKEILHAIGK